MRGPRADARPKSLMHVRAGATFSLKCAADQEHRVDAGITKTVVRPLIAEQLHRPTDLSNLAFSTTAELLPIDGLIGQTHAVDAIRFGTRVGSIGFNLFVIGANGARMHDAVKTMLAAEVAGKPSPSDGVHDRGPRRVRDQLTRISAQTHQEKRVDLGQATPKEQWI